MQRDPDHDELQRLAPTLTGIPRKDPFRVEPGFFDRFPHAVQATIAQQRQRTNRMPRVLLRYAVVSLVVVALTLAGVRFIGHPSLRHGGSEGSASTAHVVLPEDDDLVDLLLEDGLSWSASEFQPVPVLDPTELDYYLDHAGADLNELITSL